MEVASFHLKSLQNKPLIETWGKGEGNLSYHCYTKHYNLSWGKDKTGLTKKKFLTDIQTACNKKISQKEYTEYLSDQNI